MSRLQDKELDIFKRSIHELNFMGVNPVTVPRDWNIKWSVNHFGIQYMPNLLNAFYIGVRNKNVSLTKGLKNHLAKNYMEDTCFTSLTNEELHRLLLPLKKEKLRKVDY